MDLAAAGQPGGDARFDFLNRSPRGFGLLQRDRDLAHYEDLEANYHLRPSAWVEPVGDWGAGAKLDNGIYVKKIGPSGVWRTAFVLVPDGSGRPVELRCFLRKDQIILTETWSHLWNP